jgi:hypothetical protein
MVITEVMSHSWSTFEVVGVERFCNLEVSSFFFLVHFKKGTNSTSYAGTRSVHR